uniref:Uncharacterized protein n=1 Tax=viral metagenome TaxID=1070528 RepID=A0A6M3KAL7_9ZZZZ
MRQECTKETPCDGKGQWFHPAAVWIDGQDDAYTNWYECPICGQFFGETVPD